MDQRSSGSTTTIDSPVDDATYNLLQTLTSKLEAIDAYDMYEQDADDDEESQLYRELAQQDRDAAERVLQVVQRKLGGGR